MRGRDERLPSDRRIRGWLAFTVGFAGQKSVRPREARGDILPARGAWMKSIKEKCGRVGKFVIGFGLVSALLCLGAGFRPASADESIQGISSAAVSGADFRALVRSAILMVKQGEYTEAIALLEPYRARDDFSMLHALGVAYVRTQRNEEAYDALLRAHHLNPSEAGPLLPAALACARMARSCDNYRQLALEYKALGGKFVWFADKIANFQPVELVKPKLH
jgi:tetratricopeptide (TPR) repeat protein